MRWLVFALFAGAMFLAVSSTSGPAAAKSPPLTVTLAASPAAYTGPCPVAIKFTGEIDGDPGTKLSYQIARIVGGTPSVTPWTSTTMTPTGKLLVYDTIIVTVAKAGIESETLHVLPGLASATAKVPVVCATPKPTSTPTSTPTSKPTSKPTNKPNVSIVNSGVTTQITPAPTSTHAPLTNPGVALAPNARLAGPLPPPINLTQALTKDVCQAHGGSAGSLACYIGLPAGKLALVWDYPYSNAIDGYNVYRADSASTGTTTLHMQTAPKPVATQADPTWKFVVLDAQRAGSCFAVTAYHGSAESARSVRFCVGAGGVAKMVSLQSDRVGTMVVDFFVWTDKSVQDNMYSNNVPFVRDLLYLDVGYTHQPSLWRDQAHTQVSQNTNSLFRGYVHFNSGALNGRQIAQAQLSLVGGTTQGGSAGQLCLAHYGGADHLWNPGDKLNSTSQMGNGPYQGPDLHLDVTSLVQSWANAPASNLGITLDGEQGLVIYNMVILSSTCLTSFPTATLDVTYY
jgi:hypothetical protein